MRTPYDFGMRKQATPTLATDTTLLKPGLRLAVGVSGGADSVALLRAVRARSGELGLVLHVAHLHHGLRGAEAEGDLEFVRVLAAELGLPFYEARVDAAAEAEKAGESIEEAARRLRYLWFRKLLSEIPLDAMATAHTRDDQAETVCAKFLRGAWTEGLSGIYPVVEFAEGRVVRPLLATTRAAVEAYLRALGQGWREDSSNRHLAYTRNRIRHELLPLLEGWNPQLKEHLAQMAELAREEEAWWAGELSRIAPQILLSGRPVRGGGRASGDGLALDVIRLAALAPALQRRLLRYAAEQMGAALDFPATEALRALALDGRAGQKRELAGGLRAERTPRELRLTIESVTATGAVLPEYSAPIPGEIVGSVFGLRLRIEVSSPELEGGLAEDGVKGGGTISEELPSGAEQAAERGQSTSESPEDQTSGAKAHVDPAGFMPGINPRPTTRAGFPAACKALVDSAGSFVGVKTPTYQSRSTARASSSATCEASILSTDRGYGLKSVPFLEPVPLRKPVPFLKPEPFLKPAPITGAPLAGAVATLRNWRPGDRVRLRHSGGPRKVKEVLERLRVTGSRRAVWPVLEVGGRIVWMKGVELEPELGIAVAAEDLEAAGAIGITKGFGDDTLG
jgi:tRNA(Ile)-lysidine synthase